MNQIPKATLPLLIATLPIINQYQIEKILDHLIIEKPSFEAYVVYQEFQYQGPEPHSEDPINSDNFHSDSSYAVSGTTECLFFGLSIRGYKKDVSLQD